MICKPCEKSEVRFTQLLSELNASVLHYENLLLSVCRGVYPVSMKINISSYTPEYSQVRLPLIQTALCTGVTLPLLCP